jgi:dTDP-4-amino-4,6-dideoxygalactose transaminase
LRSWYAHIFNDPTDTTAILDASDYFEDEYAAASAEIDMTALRGMRVEDIQKRLPGIVGYRWRQLQELEAILGLLEIREIAVRGARRKHYLEHYNRALTATTVEKYVEADDEVLALAMIRNRLALIRNKFLAVTKQHEYLHFQLSNLTKLIVAGVNDAVF